MLFADLHIHSHFSRATSRKCTPELLDLWARRKGIGLLGTGDFTHPAWRQELREKLTPVNNGFYRLKPEWSQPDGTPNAVSPLFTVTGEISLIYKKDGRTRRVHHLILMPGLDEADDLSCKLESIGNIHSDGRPILGLDSRDFLEIVLDSCPKAILIPAHIWTPHYSVFGMFSGFDHLEECFGDLSGHIRALETGLSSDPSMNRRVGALDRFALISNSDAHSPAKLGREATLFEAVDDYPSLYAALQGQNADALKGTIEFFPEEGKYYLDGHRDCHVCFTPIQTRACKGHCPICGRKLTVGVAHRIEQLATRRDDAAIPVEKPYEKLIPLPEIIASITGVSSSSVKVQKKYLALLRELGSEFHILRQASLEDIGRHGGPVLAEAIRRLRRGEVRWVCGYDGVFGTMELVGPTEIQMFRS